MALVGFVSVMIMWISVRLQRRTMAGFSNFEASARMATLSALAIISCWVSMTMPLLFMMASVVMPWQPRKAQLAWYCFRA